MLYFLIFKYNQNFSIRLALIYVNTTFVKSSLHWLLLVGVLAYNNDKQLQTLDVERYKNIFSGKKNATLI